MKGGDMPQRMMRSAVATVALVMFAAAAVLGTAGLASSGATNRAVGLSTTLPSPLPVTACAGNTCQAMSISGTTVTNWATSTTAPKDVCTYAEYFDNGTIIAESSETCLSTGQQANALWSDPGSFPARAKLCTAWTGIPGKPCNTV
jgi:hypothetical protein